MHVSSQLSGPITLDWKKLLKMKMFGLITTGNVGDETPVINNRVLGDTVQQ